MTFMDSELSSHYFKKLDRKHNINLKNIEN